jgi:hypothetical protein
LEPILGENMLGLYCPNKCLKEVKDNEIYISKRERVELCWEQIQGMRVYKEVDGKNIYSAYCPSCKEYFEVDKNGKKI